MSFVRKTYGFLSRQVIFFWHIHGTPQFEDGQPNGGPKKFEKELKRGLSAVMVVFSFGVGVDRIGSLGDRFDKNGVAFKASQNKWAKNTWVFFLKMVGFPPHSPPQKWSF